MHTHTVCVFFVSLYSLPVPPLALSLPSLLGPRRKLSLAIAGLKEKDDVDKSQSSVTSSTNSKAGVGGESGGRDRDGGGGRGGGANSSGRGRGRGGSSRPPLFKQPSTELQAAYHQVHCVCIDTIHVYTSQNFHGVFM